jgi:anhydro-N-acetylmuramic acid kinase
MLAIGLMTGTALDGFIDSAIVRTDGFEIEELGGWRLHPYDAALRAKLAECVSRARSWEFRGSEPAGFADAERDYTLAVADAIHALVSQTGLCLSEVDVIGMHGFTVLHRPDPPVRRTRQIGDGALLAHKLGVDVAFDFRAADIASGGQGAPLAPIYHAALLRYKRRPRPATVLNLGGVANITYWAGGDDVLAFDAGPANGPINEWMERHGRGTYDADGACAAAGRVDETLISRALEHPFFARAIPKSLDRFDFNADLARGLDLIDGAATLTALCAAALARGLDMLPTPPAELIVCGGGRKNPTLMREVATRSGTQALDCDTIGWRGDAIEAELIAFIAARTVLGLPLTFPTTTGVLRPTSGGRLAKVR